MRLLLPLLFSLSLSALAVDDYKLGPLSQEKPDVPKGKVIPMPAHESKIYAGTKRDWWIYVPAQYKAEQPANLMVFQDGHDYVGLKGAWRVPVVFDNLIASGDMQPTIAIFINPGHSGEVKPQSAWKNNNRGKEYNTLGDVYARFLLEEIIPQVQKDYKLTENPEGWAIAGASSGAICAFTVAWHKPEAFGNVISFIGSYTSIGYRPATATTPVIVGGDTYPGLIRKNPIRPIRIFLQDGANDLNNEHGSWFLANQQMLSALQWANANADLKKVAGPRYDVKFEWGDGAHADTHGGWLLPGILRWMFAP